ncbi:MAG: hypothetical protein LBS74_05550 [Oscillospiraceae bacterium]|jgi:flagellar basal body-associated protein FliL|nr:hypothetical protein [Oscillospiraceae bacterium]
MQENETAAKPALKTKKLILIIAGVLVLAALVSVGYFAVYANNPLAIAKRYAAGAQDNYYSTFAKYSILDLDAVYAAKYETEDYSAQGVSKSEYLAKVKENYANSTALAKQMFAARYGKDYKVKVTETSRTIFAKSENAKFEAELSYGKENMGAQGFELTEANIYKASSFNKVIRYNFEVNTAGSLSSSSESISITMVRSGLKWYVCEVTPQLINA